MAIWCENSSSVAAPLGDLADMFEYVEDGVVDVGVVVSERALNKRQHTSNYRSGHRRPLNHPLGYVIRAFETSPASEEVDILGM